MDEQDEKKDKPDRARRRLMKLAAYIPAGIVSLSAARGRAARAKPSSDVQTTAGTKSLAGGQRCERPRHAL